MRKIKEVLRLKALGHSRRALARSVGISHSTAGVYLQAADAAGLTWEIAQELTDAQLEARLFPVAPESGGERALPTWSAIDTELRRPDVTLQLLWFEYKQAEPQGYQPAVFTSS